MAVKEFEKPELKDYSPIPKLVEQATSHLAPFKSKEEFQKSLGYPGELVENWQDIALNKMGDLLKKYRSCLLYTSPSPRDRTRSRMPSSA